MTADPTASGAPGPHGPAFSGRVGWGERPALLVVDLCRAYTEPDGPFALPGADAVVEANRRLVEAARAAAVPVVWTLVRYAPDLSDGGFFVAKVPALAAFAADAAGGWGDPTLAPADGEVVVTKQYASAFTGRAADGASLPAHLHGVGVDTLLVTGVSTSGCVRASATDALTHGLRPLVVADACGDRTPELHEQNLRDLDAKYADVVGLDEALAHLRSRSP